MSDLTIGNWLDRARQLTPRIRDFVDGDWREGRGTEIAKYGPRDGSLLYTLAAGDPSSIDDAVRAGRTAFEDGRWAGLAVQKRKQALFRLADLIEAHAEELALLECLDVGKPISDALLRDVPTAAARIRYFGEAADKLHPPVYGADADSLTYALLRPIGVVGAIVGWNYPLSLAATKIGPALAAGNSLILKPSELSSLSAARVAELAIEAGIAEGVFNVVHGGPAIGAALAQHDDVDMVSFTGSTATGKRLLVASGTSNMKRLLLECGGKAASIVFDDCPDLDAVADAVVARAFGNQGAVCTATTRLLVQDGIREPLLAKVLDKAARIRPADPLDPDARFGAIISEAHLNKIAAFIAAGVAEGSELALEPCHDAPVAGGYFLSPAIFDAVPPNSRLAQEEIFGPVLSVMSFRDESEAIAIANDTIYGLSAIAWTRDAGRAHRLGQKLRAGWVVVNATGRPCGGPGAGVMSVGGQAQSGLGTEGGLEGLEAYMTKTAVQTFL